VLDFTTSKFIIAGIFVGFALLEVAVGRFFFREQSRRADLPADIAASLIMPAVLTAILFATAWLGNTVMPQTRDQWAGLPFIAMFGILLVADDLTQYVWHRLSHTSWLYPLHRAHHSARYLSVRVVYRNNLFYYAIMPSLWISGFLVYWGFGRAYVVYVVLKMLVIIGAHSSIPWDAPLRRYALTRPLIWLLERIISTPSTHAAHHGLHATDGVTHYHGNYGNFLFLWDVIFKTAHITGRRPDEYGIEDEEEIPLFRQFIVPKFGPVADSPNPGPR
jgi:sterol desaturase/sphingolipid hydroxylase (fatty acid hydroxylase superfamily)